MGTYETGDGAGHYTNRIVGQELIDKNPTISYDNVANGKHYERVSVDLSRRVNGPLSGYNRTERIGSERPLLERFSYADLSSVVNEGPLGDYAPGNSIGQGTSGRVRVYDVSADLGTGRSGDYSQNNSGINYSSCCSRN